jgi:hypothetical protein
LACRSGEQLVCDLPQCFQLIVRNIGPIIFLEPIDEEPLVSLVGGNQRSGSATFATPGKSDTFFSPRSHPDRHQPTRWPFQPRLGKASCRSIPFFASSE